MFITAGVSRWTDELEGVVPGTGVAAHGECPVWHHLLVRPSLPKAAGYYPDYVPIAAELCIHPAGRT